MLSGLLGLVDTKEHKYDDLFNEINIHTGGIRPSFANYTDYRSDEINSYIYEKYGPPNVLVILTSKAAALESNIKSFKDRHPGWQVYIIT